MSQSGQEVAATGHISLVMQRCCCTPKGCSNGSCLGVKAEDSDSLLLQLFQSNLALSLHTMWWLSPLCLASLDAGRKGKTEALLVVGPSLPWDVNAHGTSEKNCDESYRNQTLWRGGFATCPVQRFSRFLVQCKLAVPMQPCVLSEHDSEICSECPGAV